MARAVALSRFGSSTAKSTTKSTGSLMADVEDSLKLVDLLNGQFAVLNAAPFLLRVHRGLRHGEGCIPMAPFWG